MLTVRVSARTSASPDRVLEAARDFSERRAEVWPNVQLQHLDVHEMGDTSADVTKGMRLVAFFWERCRYDWSQPDAVRAVVLDSNIMRPGSTWENRATPRDGKTYVEATFLREYKDSLKGCFAKTLFRVAGKGLAGSDLRRALSTVEKFSQPAR